jgi:two-component system response regulator RegX3
MTSLLLVEDDPDMQFALRLGLEEGGFHVSVAESGPSALDLFHARRPALVILDVVLGRESLDGFETCRRIRKVSSVPVIFLTVRGDDADHLVGLALGADDYLVKPVSTRVLCARVNMALERCSRVDASHSVLAFGDVIIDTDSREVRVRGELVELTRIEFDILAALAKSPDRVVTRDQMTSTVWGDWFGSDAHLDVHMSRLRKKILDAGGPRIGQCVRGVGFRLL